MLLLPLFFKLVVLDPAPRGLDTHPNKALFTLGLLLVLLANLTSTIVQNDDLAK